MKTALRLAALSTLAVSSFGTSFVPQAAQAATFGERAVAQDNFVAVAAPVGNTGRHQLLVIEQQSNRRDCWSENGSIVNPLLANFDFTGICGRYTDSNGYSIRTGGQDLGFNITYARFAKALISSYKGFPSSPTDPPLNSDALPTLTTLSALTSMMVGNSANAAIKDAPSVMCISRTPKV